MSKITIFNIAGYFADKKAISYRKINALCYYACALYLKLYNKKLFKNDFEAWTNGYMSLSLYKTYMHQKTYNLNKINLIDKNIALFLDKIYSIYGGYSEDELIALAHNEKPWLNARKNYQNKTISEKDIIDYFDNIFEK